MHVAASEWVRHQVARHGPFRRVVELGSRDVNGSVRPLFGAAQYIGVDIAEGPGVDVVCDAASYVPGELVDCVVCSETLEHTAAAAAIVANARAMLAPGGWLIVTAAGPARKAHSAIDGGPLREGEFYRNIQPGDLSASLDGMAAADVTVSRDWTDVYAVARAP